MMTPQLGQIVLYKLGAGDVPEQSEGGAPMSAGDVFPAMIVKVNYAGDTETPASVNLQVFADAHFAVWASSRTRAVDATDESEIQPLQWHEHFVSV